MFTVLPTPGRSDDMLLTALVRQVRRMRPNTLTRHALAGIGGVVLTTAALTMPVQAVNHQADKEFDLQAHRGGLGLVVENTLASFANGLRTGVTTLELDVQITEDGYAVVTHDRDPSTSKCVDTEPAYPGDPEFP
jgi:glycerophosphoryl diester phosphodiesterase